MNRIFRLASFASPDRAETSSRGAAYLLGQFALVSSILVVSVGLTILILSSVMNSDANIAAEPSARQADNIALTPQPVAFGASESPDSVQGEVVPAAVSLLPSAARNSCIRMAERDTRLRASVVEYKLLRGNLWEIYLSNARANTTCMVASNGFITSFANR